VNENDERMVSRQNKSRQKTAQSGMYIPSKQMIFGKDKKLQPARDRKKTITSQQPQLGGPTMLFQNQQIVASSSGVHA
jgi:hypothetical protein